MFRKILFLVIIAMLLLGAAFAQRGHQKDFSGDYFGEEAYMRPMKFIAASYAPEVTLSRLPEEDCPEGTLNVTCFPIEDPSVEQTKALPNTTRVVIPGKSLRDALVVEARNFYAMWYQCDAPGPQNGLLVYNPTITIKSPVLTSPITANVGHRRLSNLIMPDVCGTGEDMQYTRVYRLTRSILKLQGYSDKTVDDFFANDITIEMNITVRARNVDYVDAYYDLMLYGY